MEGATARVRLTSFIVRVTTHTLVLTREVVRLMMPRLEPGAIGDAHVDHCCLGELAGHRTIWVTRRRPGTRNKKFQGGRSWIENDMLQQVDRTGQLRRAARFLYLFVL